MRIPVFTTVALVLFTGTGTIPAQSRACLHGDDETNVNRTRRERAIELADEINRAEGARGFGRRGDRETYQPFDLLQKLPEAPLGFRVQLDTDGTTYSFSIKDTRDPCRYAVFSDQSGDIYEAIASPPRARLRLLTPD